MAERNPLGARSLLPDDNPLNAGAPTEADAWRFNADWLREQRAKSAQMGLLDTQTGWPTQAGWLDAASQYSNALMLGTTGPRGVRAYHGSPHSFDRFDLGKIGTGEGAQAYGHGLYFAEKEGVARSYRDALRWNGSDWNDPQYVAGFWLDASKGNAEAAAAHLEKSLKHQGTPEAKAAVSGAIDLLRNGQSGINAANPGHMYEVNIGSDPEHFLHWDKPLSEQSQHVQEAFGKMGITAPNLRGSEAWLEAVSQHGLLREGAGAPASQALHEAGIPGIRYLDQGSRGAGEGTHNVVVFDPATIEILRKYGLAGLGLGGAAAAQRSDGTQ